MFGTARVLSRKARSAPPRRIEPEGEIGAELKQNEAGMLSEIFPEGDGRGEAFGASQGERLQKRKRLFVEGAIEASEGFGDVDEGGSGRESGGVYPEAGQ